jgi:hypothetical protein
MLKPMVEDHLQDIHDLAQFCLAVTNAVIFMMMMTCLMSLLVNVKIYLVSKCL